MYEHDDLIKVRDAIRASLSAEVDVVYTGKNFLKIKVKGRTAAGTPVCQHYRLVLETWGG